ncbi:hypothetical protein CEQ21_15975 [Niallia circulans]|uniref:Uncharacterized protein n=1 Tax=Niallia circulans TaxID=1397 RepID=A0A553SJ33_NIACI|nr:hypothetical protein CEQ21_15975 [Niallia circulans]
MSLYSCNPPTIYLNSYRAISIASTYVVYHISKVAEQAVYENARTLEKIWFFFGANLFSLFHESIQKTAVRN